MTLQRRRSALRSLPWRLGISYSLVVIALLGLVLVATNAIVERALIESTADRLEIEAGLIATAGGARGVTATDLAAGDLASVLGGQETGVVVLDGTGATLASEANGAPAEVIGARLGTAAYATILAGGQSSAEVVAVGDGSSRVLLVAVPVKLRTTGPPSGHGRPEEKGPPPGRGLGNQAGTGGAAPTTTDPPNAIAQLAVSLGPIDQTLGELRVTLVAIALGLLVLAVVLVWLITAFGLNPLGRIAAVADRVAAGDLSARAGLPSGTTEIDRLARAFDGMVERVEASLRTQRQFAADASHELRSPLTVLGGYVDVLGRSELATSESGVRTLAAMRREIDRLSRLATDLLLLSQLETGSESLVPTHVDLAELVEDIGGAARVIAGNRRVDVERNGPVDVMADRDRLTQALMNLVDNAVRHTPDGGLIQLGARRDGAGAVAVVANDGQPIDPRHLPHLFDRFYRAGPHDETTRGQHAGLGLAIVKAIAEASGGDVRVASDHASTRFELRLPLVAP